MIEVSNERRDEIFHKIAEKIVDMKLTPLAIVMLESSKPLSFVASQLMVFFQPIYAAVFPTQPYNEIAVLLENRANIELLIKEIEKVENEKRIVKKSSKDSKEQLE
ncbi:MAG: hypothetical protein N2748_06200 [candidate division WOR-3 bacterium]|nr:hypothetical protein [candidate division WOR-3 bacterium]